MKEVNTCIRAPKRAGSKGVIFSTNYQLFILPQGHRAFTATHGPI